LGDISHELRSPLARLSVALGLARRKIGQEAKIELDRIEREAETINELIGHMLTLTKLESNADDLRKVEIDLAALVQQIGDDADFEANENNCRVSISRLDKCSINGLLELIHSAVENVVRNAVKYTSPETEILISLARVSERDHDYAIISAETTGRRPSMCS
jgi:two-component system sensor histidine kinase CpxA